MDLYVCTQEFGDGRNYLVGVYSSREKAQEAAQSLEKSTLLEWHTPKPYSEPYIESQYIRGINYAISETELDMTLID